MNKLVCVICGMQINEKNYNLNQKAFIEGNAKDNIKVCPFCGVSIGYLEENGELLKFDSDKFDVHTLRILDHAMKLEVFNGDFYKKAAELADDKNIKEMFKDLSKIEYMHARVHKNIGGFKEDPVLKDMDYSKYNTDEMLLDLAYKREKHAVEYYEKYSKELEHPVIKAVFKELSQVEKEHIELTQK